MKRFFSPFSIITVFSVFLILASCKKNSTTDPAVNTSSQVSQSAQINNSESASYQVANDAIQAAEYNSSISGRLEETDSTAPATPLPCSAVLTANIPNKMLTVTYSGGVCSGFIKTGTIIVQLIQGNYWKDTGAVLKVTFDNFKMTNVSTGSSIAINSGYETITNIYGGTWVRLFLYRIPLVRKIRANFNITYDSTATQNFVLTRKNTWSISGTGSATTVKLQIDGDSTVANAFGGSSITNVYTVGHTKDGTPYYASIPSSLIIQNCGDATVSSNYKFISGIYTYTLQNYSIQLTLGVDANGNTQNSCAATASLVQIIIGGQTLYKSVLPYQ